MNMSNSQTSSIGSSIGYENFDGSRIVDEHHEHFRTKNGTLWRKESKLGEGGFSQVYLYKSGGGLKCAVKRMPNVNAGGRMTAAELEKEKAALIKFSGRDHFVRFLGCFESSDIEYFVLEHVEFGDLESNLRRREKNRRKKLRKQGDLDRKIKKAEACLSETEVKTILIQILKGLEFLHADGYIHRDLNPRNILVVQKGPDWQIKITDLGLSKCTLGERGGFSFTGTLAYMAPEVYDSIQYTLYYTDKIDIWAVGCIACRMLIGEPPFLDSWVLSQYLRAIQESKSRDQLREVPYMSKDLAELFRTQTSKGLFMWQLLEPRPVKRLAASRALAHPWFRGLDFCALRGHANGVVGVAFSPDGKLLASRSFDDTIRVWSVDERQTKHILHSPFKDNAFRVLPDGKLAASASSNYDRAIGIWDMKTGQAKHKFEIPNYTSVTFSPDGCFMASRYIDGTTMLWYTETGEQKWVIKHSDALPEDIAFSPNGDLMVSRFSNGKFELRNTENGFEKSIFKGDPQFVKAVAFSPNDRVIALANDEALWLWDREEEEAKRVSESYTLPDDAMVFSPNGKWVASQLYHYNRIIVWNTEQKDEPRILENHTMIIRMAFAPNSRYLKRSEASFILWAVLKNTDKVCAKKRA